MPDNLLSDNPKPSLARRFRRHFVTGLVVLAPVWLTVYIVLLVVRLLGGLLSPQLRYIAEQFIDKGQHIALIRNIADIAAFLVTVILIALVGFAVSRVMGKRALEVFDSLLRRIPFVKEVYGGIRQVSDVMFGDKSGFQRVVAVRFPNEQSWSIGFMTSEKPWEIPDKSGNGHITVFVPTAPNPTSGFLMFFKSSDIVPLSMTVDEAMKVIVSVGTISPGQSKAAVAPSSSPQESNA